MFGNERKAKKEIRKTMRYYEYYATDEETENFLNKLQACRDELKPCMKEIVEEIIYFRRVLEKQRVRYQYLKEQRELYKK